MKKIIIIFIFLFSMIAHAHLNEGIYAIEGVNSLRGPYVGKLQILNNSALRLIKFNGDELESIWEGTLNSEEIVFNLRVSNVLTSYNDFTVTDDELKNQLSVKINRANDNAIFEVGRDGNYSEHYTLTSEVNIQPIWRNLRIRLNARNDNTSLKIKLVLSLGLDKMINWYRSEMSAHEEDLVTRPEYLKGEQWQYFDPTDFNFYRANNETLRIVNKTINPLSVAEAVMRKNAYSKTLDQKAEFFDKQINQLHLNEAGLLELAQVDQNGQKISGSIEGDSCLWTGMYIWSQVLRYEQTNSDQALSNIKKAVNGLLTLIDITNDPTEFARTLLVSPASENKGTLYIQGKGKYSNLKWIANGNNDMSKGLMIGFASVYKILKNNDPELFNRVILATKRMPQLKAFSQSYYNRAVANGLIAMYSDSINTIALKNFKDGIADIRSNLSYKLGIDSGINWKSLVDMSGNNLSMTSTLAVLLISNQLLENLPNIRSQQFNINKINNFYKKVLKTMDQDTRSGHRGFMTIAAYKMTMDPELKLDAINALWCLKEIPAPRHIGNGIADLKRLPDWSPSAWPSGHVGRTCRSAETKT